MKRLLNRLLLFVTLPLLSLSGGCDYDIPAYPNSPEGNFEALWRILDERYCFFEYKNIDWDVVHDRYRAKIRPDMRNRELFDVLAAMLAELKDGHVNLVAPFDMSRYWKWFEDYPPNFDYNIVERNYLLPNYRIAGGMKYTMVAKNIGYIYYGSFAYPMANESLDYIMGTFHECKGLIIDVRNNGGGLVTVVNDIAGRFIDQRVETGYISHKTGPGHDDFSEPYPTHLDPVKGIHFNGKIVVLTNRGCYSATNNFVSVMKLLPQVTVIGDRTGGGSGMPFSSEIPNGWSVRFSASPIFTPDMEQTEFGIDPDIHQDMEAVDALQGKDSIIERAIMELSRTQ